ncbi:MAG: tRNA(His) guanylyltransferase Thg1 family protein [Thermodesulfobacteriota bacterium]
MALKALEARMRSLEYFHSLRLLPRTWTIIRVDGRNFTNFTSSRFEKPFDLRFRDFMVVTAQTMLGELCGVYAHTTSDEISVLFSPKWDLFDRELEKLVSVSAGIASAAFTHACGEPVHFDSRIWLGIGENDVVDYFHWRQSDAARCALHSWCYWTLRRSGSSSEEATASLKGRSWNLKNELLFQHGINFNDLPVWQRRGVGLYWETYEKEGYDPIKRMTVSAVRRRIRVDYELPMKDAYKEFLRGILSTLM